jgi:hypothetical protein
MSLPVAAYAPWGNAELAFTVSGGTTAVDPETGNVVAAPVVLTYLAALRLQRPNVRDEPGADVTLYRCDGRLLSPAVLDPRITNGSEAEARVNGYLGRFVLEFDLAQDEPARPFIRQSIGGSFRVVGGRPLPTMAAGGR